MLRGADAIAAFAEASASREWSTLRDRAAAIRGAFAARAASTDRLAGTIRTQWRTLQSLAEADFTTLLLVVGCYMNAWRKAGGPRATTASGWVGRGVMTMLEVAAATTTSTRSKLTAPLSALPNSV